MPVVFTPRASKERFCVGEGAQALARVAVQLLNVGQEFPFLVHGLLLHRGLPRLEDVVDAVVRVDALQGRVLQLGLRLACEAGAEQQGSFSARHIAPDLRPPNLYLPGPLAECPEVRDIIFPGWRAWRGAAPHRTFFF